MIYIEIAAVRARLISVRTQNAYITDGEVSGTGDLARALSDAKSGPGH